MDNGKISRQLVDQEDNYCECDICGWWWDMNIDGENCPTCGEITLLKEIDSNEPVNTEALNQ